MTPILKPGKIGTDPTGYRPISNLYTVEKIIEELMKEDLKKFVEDNSIIPEHHHSSRNMHSTVTAKAVIDREINTLKDKTKNITLLTMDLTATFDTCDSMILLNMLEHIGVRHLELEIMRTYPTDRSAFVEV